MKSNLVFKTSLAIMVFNVLGCSDAEVSKPRELLREALSQAVDLPAARPLAVARQMPADADNPVSLSYDAEGGLILVDGMAHRLLSIDPAWRGFKTLSGSGLGGGFRFPTRVLPAGDEWVVLDGEGFKWVGRDGRLQRTARPFLTVHDFALDISGNIYVNPIYNRISPDKPLIIQLDAEGAELRRFGNRIPQSRYRGEEDRVFLAVSRERLFAAYKCLPRVDVYDLKSGGKVQQVAVRHPMLDRLLEAYASIPNDNPREVWAPRLIAGVRLVEDRLLVLLQLPWLEVVEFDLEGRERARYRNPQPGIAAASFGGFAARREGGSYRLSFVVRPEEPGDPSLLEATAVRPGPSPADSRTSP